MPCHITSGRRGSTSFPTPQRASGTPMPPRPPCPAPKKATMTPSSRSMNGAGSASNAPGESRSSAAACRQYLRCWWTAVYSGLESETSPQPRRQDEHNYRIRDDHKFWEGIPTCHLRSHPGKAHRNCTQGYAFPGLATSVNSVKCTKFRNIHFRKKIDVTRTPHTHPQTRIPPGHLSGHKRSVHVFGPTVYNQSHFKKI